MKRFFLILSLFFFLVTISWSALSKRLLLFPVKGIVEYSLDGKTWNQLLKKIIIEGKVYLYTHPKSRTQIIFSDMSEIKIEENTKIKIAQNSVFLWQGDSWFKVEKQLRGELLIHTPTSIAGIRGTEFEVKVDEKTKYVSYMVYKGIIEVRNKFDSKKILLPQSKMLSVFRKREFLPPKVFNPKVRLEKIWKYEKWQRMKFEFLKNGPRKILPKDKLGKAMKFIDKKVPFLKDNENKMRKTIHKSVLIKAKKTRINKLKNKIRLIPKNKNIILEKKKLPFDKEFDASSRVIRKKGKKYLMRPQDVIKRFDDKGRVPRNLPLKFKEKNTQPGAFSRNITKKYVNSTEKKKKLFFQIKGNPWLNNFGKTRFPPEIKSKRVIHNSFPRKVINNSHPTTNSLPIRQ